TLFLAEAIPKAAHGLDDVAGFPEFFAQAAYVRVHGAGVDHGFVAPDFIEQFIAILHAASARYQCPQQFELETGKTHPLPAHANLVTRRIDRDRARLERLLWFFPAPKNCPNPQPDFARAERLGDIIVCTEFQADDAINLVRLRR